MIEEHKEGEFRRENLQEDFQLEDESKDEEATNEEAKVLKRLHSSDSHGSYGNDIIEDIDDAFEYHGSMFRELEEKEDDHDDDNAPLEHKESESPLTLTDAPVVIEPEVVIDAEPIDIPTTLANNESAEVVVASEDRTSSATEDPLPKQTTEVSVELVAEPAVEVSEVQATEERSGPDETSAPVLDTAVAEPQSSPGDVAPDSPAPELTSPSVRNKPVRISEAKLYAKMNEGKEPVTPITIETGRLTGRENSVRSVSRDIDKSFSMRTPENPGESTDQIKNWIKSTLSGKKFQRKDIVTASHDSYDEDSGEVKRRSWSFKKTPENTPDKSATKPERPKSQSITPTSSAKIKSAMKDSSMDSNSDTPSMKKHASGSKLRFADKPLPSPRSEYGFGAESDAGRAESGAVNKGPEMSPVAFRKPSFNFENVNTSSAVIDGGSGSAPTTPTGSSMRLSTASDASNEDNDFDDDDYDQPAVVVRTTAADGTALTPQQQQQLQQDEEARLAHLKRLRKTDSQRLQREASASGSPMKETYDRSKLRTVQLETKPSKKFEPSADEEEPVKQPVVEEKKEIPIVYHPIKYLQECNLHKKFDGLLVGTLEAHLTDDDFKRHFGVKRDDYYKQPQWKQHDKKKRLGLF